MEHNSMNREYHVQNRTNINGEQALVYAVTRDENNKTIRLNEIYIVTIVEGIETKTVVNIDEIMPKLAEHPGGNVPRENLKKMGEILENVLTVQTKIDLKIHELETIVETKESDRLFVASEAALSAHPTNQSIEDIVNGKLKKY